MCEELFTQVYKPGRYIGREWNVSRKDFTAADVRFALCFPDLYEVGMSNLGIRILYGVLNRMEGVCCERCFAPAQDMEALLRAKGLGLCSLESRRGLREFDLVGFSLGHELGYTNVLNILELGGIPLEASARDFGMPLVIGGGPCAINPEPMYEFFDLFVIGEAEEAIEEIITLYRRHKDNFKSGRMSRQDLLHALSCVEGVYVPSLYDAAYDPGSGALREFKPNRKDTPPVVRKRFIKNLDAAFFPQEWLLPYIEIIHDRITLELTRGCPNRCRFCQARTQYFPLRQRSPETVLRLADQTYQSTGYEEISLVGLSVSDYPHIGDLLSALISRFKEKAVGISLPSIKPRIIVAHLSSLISTIKKTGLTFAPEAANERLRKVINKQFDMEDFLKVMEEAYRAGYQRVKLYFMTGLPGETESDLDDIVTFSTQVSELRRKLNRPAGGVGISINTLIPKPHTPFQWLGMQAVAQIVSTQEYLARKIKGQKFKLSQRNAQMSFIEAVLSRGDRRLSRVILSAYRKGARFDSWDNYFDYRRWLEACTDNGIEPEFYIKAKPAADLFPWDFIDTGVTKGELLKEFESACADADFKKLLQ
jgi:radical SAM family uncharacterized protein